MERIYSAFFNHDGKFNRSSSYIPSDLLSEEQTEQIRHQLRRHRTLLIELLVACRSGLRVFAYAYGAKAFTAVLLASRKWNSLEYGYADALRLLLKRDTVRFGLFLGTLVGSFRAIESICRFIRGQKDSRNNAIAGCLSGLSLLIDSKSRREIISLYLFIRALDVVGRHLVCSGHIPYYKYTSESLFALSNGPIMYAFILEPHLISRSYYKWILQMGSMTHEGLDISIRDGFRKNGVDKDGNILKLRPCQPHYHLESCVTHNFIDWFRGFWRASQIYWPVHVLPALAFRFHELRKNPFSTTQALIKSIFRSCAFLTSYQVIVKSSQCILRHTLHADRGINGWIGGISTGVSLFFEHPKRRSELMLYCAPRGLEVIWKLLERKKLVKRIKHGEVALFCLSIALIMSSPSQHLKSTYLKIIKFMFGRDVMI